MRRTARLSESYSNDSGMNRSESASITSVDLVRVEHTDCQAFARELIDDVEHAVLPPVVGTILDEVVGPDMIGILAASDVLATSGD